MLFDVIFSLLTAWPAVDADAAAAATAATAAAEEAMLVVSVVIDCDGVGSVGVFGGDSSFTCRADFNLSMTALNEPFRFLFG